MGRLAIAVTNALGSSLDPLTAFMNGSAFFAPLKYSLILERGTGSATFTRASVATVVDHEGLVKNVKSGEARFTGARRVENLVVTSSEVFSAAWNANATITTGVADPLGGTSAVTITATGGGGKEVFQALTLASGTQVRNSWWVRRRTGTGNIAWYTGADAAAFVQAAGWITSSWQRLASDVATAAGAGGNRIGLYLFTQDDAIDIWHPMFENVTGQANQNPSEYVSVGVLSAPYHGAGVDGVQYFPYENPCSVA